MSETHQKAVSFLQVPDVDAIVVPVGGGKTALFAPFIYKMHYFTKTGSGQTWGKLKKVPFSLRWRSDRRYRDGGTKDKKHLLRH
jgi:hypothetical protein